MDAGACIPLAVVVGVKKHCRSSASSEVTGDVQVVTLMRGNTWVS